MFAYSDVDEPSGSDAADDLIEEEDDDVIDLEDEPVTTGQIQSIRLENVKKLPLQQPALTHTNSCFCRALCSNTVPVS